jgi:hypothetical protein
MTILLPSLALGLGWIVVVQVALRFLPERLRPAGDVPASTMLSGIVLIFAFVLGLTVSQENTTLDAAGTATATEANSIGELYWDAHALAQAEHSRL